MSYNLQYLYSPPGCDSSGWKNKSCCIEVYEKILYFLLDLVPQYETVNRMFKSSSVEHDVHLVKYGPIRDKEFIKQSWI